MKNLIFVLILILSLDNYLVAYDQDVYQKILNLAYAKGGVDFPCADLEGVSLNNATLTNAILNEANLSKAKLHSSKLNNAKLSGANLSHADLGTAEINRTNLSGADLTGADLTGAKLYNTDFKGANLSGANLSCSVIVVADFSGANLTGVNLYNARIINSIMPDGSTYSGQGQDYRNLLKATSPTLFSLQTDTATSIDPREKYLESLSESKKEYLRTILIKQSELINVDKDMLDDIIHNRQILQSEGKNDSDIYDKETIKTLDNLQKILEVIDGSNRHSTPELN